MEKGIITIAFGAEYDRIAAACMKYSLRFTDLPICVSTNLREEYRSDVWAEIPNVTFLEHNKTDSFNRAVKVRLALLSPFENTIYIDADAVIQKQGIERVFEPLDHGGDFVLNVSDYWQPGNRIPNIYARALLATGAKLPMSVYNGGFIAWRKNPATNDAFGLWKKYWQLTGSGRDMPALACAIQQMPNLKVIELYKQPVFAPSSKQPECIIQHNYNDTFFEDFDLPRFQESKPFDSDPTDFHMTDFRRVVTIKSHNGIGDLLFVTPAFRAIKEAYPDCRLIVNTNRPTLLQNNPYVDEVGTANEGVFLGYTAPDTGRLPTEHHIIEDWRIVCNEYNLKTDPPEIRPELYIPDLPAKREVVGVQVLHKRNYHSKRVWHGFEELAARDGFEAIPEITEGDKMTGLVRSVAGYKAVVCCEGGISHIAAALRVPAVVLFGGFSDPEWTGYPDHINITSDIDCKHCYNNKPCERDFECWQSISVDYVAEVATGQKEKFASKNPC
jgi:hypothetical protein